MSVFVTSSSPVPFVSTRQVIPIVRQIITPVTSPTLSPVLVDSRYSVANPRPVLALTGVPYLTNGRTVVYDSGIGENPLARMDTINYFRYKFLDKWLYHHSSDLLKSLKVSNGNVVVIKSQDEIKNNDVTKDSEKVLMQKGDFIGDNILTKRKVEKILDTIVFENGMKWYDLPHNEEVVKRALGKYVKRKLAEYHD